MIQETMEVVVKSTPLEIAATVVGMAGIVVTMIYTIYRVYKRADNVSPQDSAPE